MGHQPEINKSFSAQEIADFVINNDKEDIFSSAKLNKEQFIQAIQRLNDSGFVIIFKNEESLHGVLGWYFLTDENKHEASKATWRLPDSIVDGDILYLSFISTKGNCDVLAIKNLFEEMGYRERITRRRGYTKGRWYERRIAKKEENP